MRIVGLDLGYKSLGICISDELKISLNPIINLKFKTSNLEEFLNQLLINLQKFDNEIELIVLGNPLHTTNSNESKMSLFVNQFKTLINTKTKYKAVLFDERFTTINSYQILKEQGINSKKAKPKKDMIAACLILQNYLDKEEQKKHD